MFRRMRRRKREPWRVAEECGEMVVRVAIHGPKRVSFGACPYFFPRRGYPHAPQDREEKGGGPRQQLGFIHGPSGGARYPPPVVLLFPHHVFSFPHLSVPPPSPLDRSLSTDLDGDDGGKTDPRRDTSRARGSFLSMGHVSEPQSKGGCQGTLPPLRMRFRCYRLERSRNPLPRSSSVSDTESNGV